MEKNKEIHTKGGLGAIPIENLQKIGQVESRVSVLEAEVATLKDGLDKLDNRLWKILFILGLNSLMLFISLVVQYWMGVVG